MKIRKTEIVEVKQRVEFDRDIEVELGEVDVWFDEGGPYVTIYFQDAANPDEDLLKVPIGWDKFFETAKDSWGEDDDAFDAMVAGLRKTADRLEEWYESLSVREEEENEQTPTPIVTT